VTYGCGSKATDVGWKEKAGNPYLRSTLSSVERTNLEECLLLRISVNKGKKEGPEAFGVKGATTAAIFEAYHVEEVLAPNLHSVGGGFPASDHHRSSHRRRCLTSRS
jgi:hypothetical protein